VTEIRIGAGPPAPPWARAYRLRRRLLVGVRAVAWPVPLLLFVALLAVGVVR